MRSVVAVALVAAALLRFAAADAVVESPSKAIELIVEFEQWFSAVGGTHANFSLEPHPSFRRWTIVAGQDLREGDVLFQVPLNSTMYVLVWADWLLQLL